jgi:para-nitrobenzyl esterase
VRGEESSDRRVFEAIAGDAVFWAPATRLAAASSRVRPTFVYRFDWCSPFMGGSLGACHGIELPFVFGTTDHPFVGLFSGSGEAAVTLSDAVQSAWVSFATGGRPGAVQGIDWPRYDEDRRATLVLDREIAVAERPREEEREIWDELLSDDPGVPTISPR